MLAKQSNTLKILQQFCKDWYLEAKTDILSDDFGHTGRSCKESGLACQGVMIGSDVSWIKTHKELGWAQEPNLITRLR